MSADPQAVQSQIQSITGGNVVDWLVQRYGPAAADLLLEWLLKLSGHGVQAQGVLPNQAASAFGGKVILAIALDRYGKLIIDEISRGLEGNSDIASRMAATLLKVHGDEILEKIKALLA